MKISRNRLMAIGLGAIALLILQACVVSGEGMDGAVGVGIGYDYGYYEPYGYDYGGWGGGYRVGPGRGGEVRSNRPSHSFRPAPASRPTPSIPGRSRRR